MTVSETTPTPEQLAACERAMDGLEAQADIWADEINLVVIIKNIGQVSRKLTDRMPPDIREGFINRQEAHIDALVRQAYLEGFDRGGESRKAYDEARTAAALSDQVVVSGWRTDFENAPSPCLGWCQPPSGDVVRVIYQHTGRGGAFWTSHGSEITVVKWQPLPAIETAAAPPSPAVGVG